MKKLMLVSLIVIVAVLVLGTAGYAYAQTQQPNSGSYGQGMMGGGYGNDRRGGPGMMGGGYGIMGGYDDDGDGYGPMHDYMLQGFADAFGLTVEELQAKLDAGETMYSLAEAQGMTLEQFRELMIQVRTDALTQMVADGVITQAQADWMLDHMS
ncbi:MAG: hypothetical protein A2W36_01770, partial [Chloroflexi bacterium RBG_16_58_14]